MARDRSLRGPVPENLRLLKAQVGSLYGFKCRELMVPVAGAGPVPAFVIFLEAHVDRERVEEHLLRPLLETGVQQGEGWPGALTPNSQPAATVSEAVRLLFRGFVLIQVGISPEVHTFDVANMPSRAIEPPKTENSVSGPREAFTENIVLTMSQVRRRLPGPQLRLETLWLGQEAPVQCILAHLDGKPPADSLAGLRERLKKVKLDGLQDVTELAEATNEGRLSVFPTLLITERPDMVAHFLKGGRIAVFLENSPRALVLPATFLDFFFSPDDFYEWRPFVLLLRLLRVLAFNIAVPLPAIYVSVTTYHLQALPTQLTLSLLAQREGAPLPPPVEALIMTLIFEILREAGIRLPQAIGATVSIVGGLVIGEAAIRSGVTSPAMVLVVSATAVATFSLPSTTLANSATYIRFFMLFLASMFGFFGLLLGYLIVLANLAGMTSLGVPYAAPLFPLIPKYLSSILGIQPRPPANPGPIPADPMVRTAKSFQRKRRKR